MTFFACKTRIVTYHSKFEEGMGVIEKDGLREEWNERGIRRTVCYGVLRGRLIQVLLNICNVQKTGE